jgi:hypothetical protein
MRFRSTITLLAVLLLGGAAVDLLAKQRGAAMVVRVNVLRTCSVDMRGSGAAEGAVQITCSRGSGTEAGVLSTVSGASGSTSISRVIPVPARETTVVASRPTLLAAASGFSGSSSARVASRQVVTLNF